MKRIAFLGLGIMGAPMARRLLDHGLQVTVWNRNAARAAPLVDAGARLAESPAQAASNAEAVIAMLSDVDASRTVWLGPAGALAAMQRGTLAIDSSTLTVEWMRESAGPPRRVASASSTRPSPVARSRRKKVP
jgi:3-hydroxyisobutyrate dehydrogenase-like beta-hydroxyacid dehydrogenase